MPNRQSFSSGPHGLADRRWLKPSEAVVDQGFEPAAEAYAGQLHKLEIRKTYRLLIERERANTPCLRSKLSDQRIRKRPAPLF